MQSLSWESIETTYWCLLKHGSVHLIAGQLHYPAPPERKWEVFINDHAQGVISCLFWLAGILSAYRKSLNQQKMTSQCNPDKIAFLFWVVQQLVRFECSTSMNIYMHIDNAWKWWTHVLGNGVFISSSLVILHYLMNSWGGIVIGIHFQFKEVHLDNWEHHVVLNIHGVLFKRV